MPGRSSRRRVWLVLCPSSDVAGRWAFEGLRARGLTPIDLVTSESLAYARWDHRVGSAGASVSMDLPDGRSIRHDDVNGVLNRLAFVPGEALTLIHQSDREYVHQELNAFFISWLHALPGPMLNPPTPQGLCGRMRYWSEWCHLAVRAGLPTAPYRQSSRETAPPFALHARAPHSGPVITTVIVIGERVVGTAVPAPVAAACARFATLARTPILGVEFSTDRSQTWQFSGVTMLPDLRWGGDGAVDALAQALCSSAVEAA